MTPSHAALVEEVAALMKATRNSGTPGRDQPSWESTAAAVLHLVRSWLSEPAPEVVEASAAALVENLLSQYEPSDWEDAKEVIENVNDAKLASAAISAFLAVSPLTPGDGNKE